MIKKHEPTGKAVDKIGSELAKSVRQSQDGLPIVPLKDGQVCCPGCSLETPVIDPGPGVKWVQMNVACQSCHTEFIVRDKAAGPSQMQDSGSQPDPPPEPKAEGLYEDLTKLVDKHKKPEGGDA